MNGSFNILATALIDVPVNPLASTMEQAGLPWNYSPQEDQRYTTGVLGITPIRKQMHRESPHSVNGSPTLRTRCGARSGATGRRVNTRSANQETRAIVAKPNPVNNL
jgi:hypothetical protein